MQTCGLFIYISVYGGVSDHDGALSPYGEILDRQQDTCYSVTMLAFDSTSLSSPLTDCPIAVLYFFPLFFPPVLVHFHFSLR
jgi:hypothetical protein